MASLYQIEENLQRIISEIEDNGGEFTPEQEQELKINEQDFKEKLDSYANAITMFKSETTCCKDEKKRINELQKTKENVIERLKSSMLDAVLRFGDNGKTGNKVVETSTHKYFTKSTTNVNIDEVRLQFLLGIVGDFIRDAYKSGVYGILIPGMEFDNKATLDAINTLRDNTIDDIDEYNISDLKYANVKISFNISLLDVLTTKAPIIKTLMDNFGLETEISKYKDDYKEAIAIISENNEEPLTVAKLETSTSLCQK